MRHRTADMPSLVASDVAVASGAGRAVGRQKITDKARLLNNPRVADVGFRSGRTSECGRPATGVGWATHRQTALQ